MSMYVRKLLRSYLSNQVIFLSASLKRSQIYKKMRDTHEAKLCWRIYR